MKVDVRVDSNRKSPVRRSTSGGTMMLNGTVAEHRSISDECAEHGGI